MWSGVIFDMDGVLIDSEPFWRQAEVELFKTVGIHLTDESCKETTGIRIQEVVQYRFEQSPQPNLPTIEAFSERIVERVIELVRQRGVALDGVQDALSQLDAMRIPIGLASSSPYNLIEAILSHLKLSQIFSVTCSAQDESLGKPNPAVYLTAARKLGVPPERCLAIEDSLSGCIAAKAARMECLVVPAAEDWDVPGFGVADYKHRSLAAVTFRSLKDR